MILDKALVVAKADLKLAMRVKMVKYGIIGMSAMGPVTAVFMIIITGMALPSGDPQIAIIFPMASTILAVFSIIPATMISANALVGEREQRTLEPLLCTPLTDRELLLGKTLSSFIPSITLLYCGTIVTSITNPYQTFVFRILIDQNDILLEKMYGQDKIKLKIRLLEQRGVEVNLIDFELMYVKANYDLIMKIQQSEGHERERIPFDLVAVPREAFKTATTTVNKIYLNKTPKAMIEDLISSFTNATVKYDTEGENKLEVDQTIVYPTTLIKAISYLNSTYGLFEGPTVQFIDKDIIANANLKIIVDYSFGNTAMILPIILGKLDCETISLNSHVDYRKTFITKETKEKTRYSKSTESSCTRNKPWTV